MKGLMSDKDHHYCGKCYVKDMEGAAPQLEDDERKDGAGAGQGAEVRGTQGGTWVGTKGELEDSVG